MLGVLGVLAVPVAVAATRYSAEARLLDAAWAIPVAALFSVAALLVVRGLSGHVRVSVAPSPAVRLGRLLAIAGVCVTLSAAIAVGFYEILLRLEG